MAFILQAKRTARGSSKYLRSSKAHHAISGRGRILRRPCQRHYRMRCNLKADPVPVSRAGGQAKTRRPAGASCSPAAVNRLAAAEPPAAGRVEVAAPVCPAFAAFAYICGSARNRRRGGSHFDGGSRRRGEGERGGRESQANGRGQQYAHEDYSLFGTSPGARTLRGNWEETKAHTPMPPSRLSIQESPHNTGSRHAWLSRIPGGLGVANTPARGRLTPPPRRA